MAEAKQGDTVKVHYTGKLEDGRVFDSSINREPLEFKISEGRIIPGFEKAVVGMILGESKTIKVPPEEAYGPHMKELVMDVDRKEIPKDLKVEVGQQLQVRQPNGETTVATVAGASETKVVLDANHPLAGKDLIFDIQLLAIV